ncbi:MAG: EutN/CcmL family microcompartment protein [Oscillospiraceae bacterium]|nr:EutN/CcmL family microcompartment protein [Oscillospiraceae bacterium]
MNLGIVKGTVVSTNKAEKLYGLKLLIVKPIDIETWQEKGAPVVAIDAVGAGEGEIVMTVSGSSSRQTTVTENKPVDQTIIAIIDHVDVNGKRIFEKFNQES